MGAQKTVRELRKLVEPMGYELEGLNGNGHLVFVHRESGAVWRASTDSGKGIGWMRGQAERNIRHAESASQLFVNYVLKRAQVGPRDTKTVELNIGRMAYLFKADHPEVTMSRSLPSVALKHHPQVEILKPAPHGGNAKNSVTMLKLTGALVGVVEIEVPKEEKAHAVAPGVIGGKRRPAVVAESDVREARPAEREVAAGGAGEPDTERDAAQGVRVDTGVALPAELVESLRDALSGDLKAENDLLRSTLEEALAGLDKLTEAVTEALTLHASPENHTRVASRRKPLRIGTLMHKRIGLIKAHRAELPDPMTAAEMQTFLNEQGEPNLSENAAGHVLWTCNELGVVFERVGRGLYGWRAE